VNETDRGTALSFLVGCVLLVGGFFGMFLIGVACQDYGGGGRSVGGVACGAVGDPNEPGWWLAALAPFAAFVVIRKRARGERALGAVVALVAVAAAFYVLLVAHLTGNV
jgi:hypothetical protein